MKLLGTLASNALYTMGAATSYPAPPVTGTDLQNYPETKVIMEKKYQCKIPITSDNKISFDTSWGVHDSVEKKTSFSYVISKADFFRIFNIEQDDNSKTIILKNIGIMPLFTTSGNFSKEDFYAKLTYLKVAAIWPQSSGETKIVEKSFTKNDAPSMLDSNGNSLELDYGGDNMGFNIGYANQFKISGSFLWGDAEHSISIFGASTTISFDKIVTNLDFQVLDNNIVTRAEAQEEIQKRLEAEKLANPYLAIVDPFRSATFTLQNSFPIEPIDDSVRLVIEFANADQPLTKNHISLSLSYVNSDVIVFNSINQFNAIYSKTSKDLTIVNSMNKQIKIFNANFENGRED